MSEGLGRPRSLYAINEDLDAILLAMDSEDGWIEESVNAAIDGWLEANKDEIAQKIDDYCKVIADRTAMAKARRVEATQLITMAQGDERVATKLKERARDFFDRLGIEKMETLHFKPKVQANGGTVPVILTAEPEKLPEEYQTVTISANVEAIRNALEAGFELEFAKLGDRGRHFRVR